MAEIIHAFRPDHALFNVNLGAWPLFSIAENTNFSTPVLKFDASTSEFCFWPFRAFRYPGSGDVSVDIDWYPDAGSTTGNVRWQAGLMAYTPNTDTGAFTTSVGPPTGVEITANNLGATARRLHRNTITITAANNGGLALDDYANLRIARIGGNAFDTLTDDATLVAVALRYNDSA